ncbi:hypothetical protein ACFFRR_009513 [Megaselia abdita]
MEVQTESPSLITSRADKEVEKLVTIEDDSSKRNIETIDLTMGDENAMEIDSTFCTWCRLKGLVTETCNCSIPGTSEISAKANEVEVIIPTAKWAIDAEVIPQPPHFDLNVLRNYDPKQLSPEVYDLATSVGIIKKASRQNITQSHQPVFLVSPLRNFEDLYRHILLLTVLYKYRIGDVYTPLHYKMLYQNF